MIKKNGVEVEFDESRIIRSIVACGCPQDIAKRIVGDIPDTNTQDVRDFVVAGLIEHGLIMEANMYKTYSAGFTDAALRVLKERYLLRNADGYLSETPTELFGRVAVCLALPSLRGDEPPETINDININTFHKIQYNIYKSRESVENTNSNSKKFANTTQKYFDIMMNRRFLPNSPCLMNAGSSLGQLSACFVLDMPDTLAGIMDTAKNTAMIFQSGGGVGINYSDLRPVGSIVKSTSGVASGPISFMTLIDGISDVVKQGGRRRGANMGILDISHPDILDFIRVKQEKKMLLNFNISVGTNDEFWEAVQNKTEYNGMSADSLLDEIAISAHRSAEPGVIFFDEINRHNIIKEARGKPIRSTNPCWGGETKVLTREGPKSFYDLALGPSKVEVLTREEDGTLSYRIMQNPGITQRDAKLKCLIVESKENGECMAFRCTPNHKVYVVSSTGITKKEVRNLTPGTSLASLYFEDGKYEQTVGMTIPKDEVPVQELKGTGHPKKSILPVNMFESRKKKTKTKSGEGHGFLSADNTVIDTSEKPKNGFFSRFKRKNHRVLAILSIGNDDVYNGMVDETHNYFVECGEGHYILSGNCGEQALYPNESCNLGSINLSEYVEDEKIQWDDLERDVRLCTRMLDGVVDMTRYPTDDVAYASIETRRIGLGVMGVADMLMKLKIPYNTETAYKLFSRLAEFISYYSIHESVNLAKESKPFPLYEQSGYTHGQLPFRGDYENAYLDWDELKQHISRYGVRNVLTTTIAPTGTISMIAGCSSGIEPLFALAYEKEVSVGTFHYGCPVLESRYPELIEEISKNHGIIPENTIPDPEIYRTSREIHWADHILAQSFWQKWIGNSISKTINMPQSTTIQDIKSSYILAQKLGCRGITVYRDNSRDKQVLKTDKKNIVNIPDPEPSDIARRYLSNWNLSQQ